MLDNVLVKRVGDKTAFWCGELQLLTRHEPKQIAFPTAMRTITFDNLTYIALNLKCNPTTMAASFINHCNLLSGRTSVMRSQQGNVLGWLHQQSNATILMDSACRST
jgi:hypothetical protein